MAGVRSRYQRAQATGGRGRRANEQLRESEERFRLAIDEAPIGMALVALDGRFVRVNQALCEIVGYSADELTELTFQAITHPDDLNADLGAKRPALSRRDPAIPAREAVHPQGWRDRRRHAERLDSARRLGQASATTSPKSRTSPSASASRSSCASPRRSPPGSSPSPPTRSSRSTRSSASRMFNEGAEKIFGYSKAEAIGAPLDMLIPERFRAVHRQHVDAFAARSDVARKMGERGGADRRAAQERRGVPGRCGDLEARGRRDAGPHGRRCATSPSRSESRTSSGSSRRSGSVLASTLDYEETLSRIAELAVRDLADFCIVDRRR